MSWQPTTKLFLVGKRCCKGGGGEAKRNRLTRVHGDTGEDLEGARGSVGEWEKINGLPRRLVTA